MRRFLSLFVMILLIVGSSPLFSKTQVGELVYEPFSTPHPYPGKTVIEKVFHYPNAGYIAIHFSNFDLAPGDYVEIYSPDGRFSYTFKEKGKPVKGSTEVISTFWATHIPGDTAVLKLYSHSRKGGWGFEVDHWARGYERGYIEAATAEMEFDAQIESVCSADDKEWAKCYDGTEMYNKSRAVCRLLIGGVSACTGWLLGSEGHVVTNYHCIDSQTDASNTDYEFMAEGSTCTTSCASWGACPGVVEASSGTLIDSDYSLDYALILLPSNITSTYGYLQLRETLPVLDERIYIPQHPNAWGKQLAVVSDVDGPYANVYSTNESPCIGGPGDIGYYADTDGGSSGSPVLAYSDHLVVALHHCAACPNRGVPIPSIIASMGTAIPNDAISGGCTNPPTAPSGLGASAIACDQISLSWTDNSGDESGFKIERSTDGVNFTEIDTAGSNVTSYSDYSVAENTTYYYRIFAYNSCGNSSYSNTANATTPTCPATPPAAPSDLSGKGLPGRVQLSWDDNSGDEDGFNIYRGTSSTNLTLVDTVSPNVTSYQDSDLVRRTTYYYKVCAYNSNGESCSAVISVRTK